MLLPKPSQPEPPERVHSRWRCAEREGLGQECQLPTDTTDNDFHYSATYRQPGPGPCLCVCHGYEEEAKNIAALGIHVHEWKVRTYDAPGKQANFSIRCRVCRLSVPPSDRIVSP